MFEEGESYDISPVTFSPEGRLYQVEYAREAVKGGSPAVGMIFKDGIMFMARHRVFSPIEDQPRTAQKMHRIAENIGAVTSGLVADARVLVDLGRSTARRYRLLYGACPSPLEVCKEIGDLMQLYTQFSGLRPFGTVVLVGGMERCNGGMEGGLYEIDPSGAVIPYYATAIGEHKDEMIEFLEESYRPGLSFKSAIKMSVDTINAGLVGEEITQDNLAEEVICAVITKDGYQELNKSYLEKFKWK